MHLSRHCVGTHDNSTTAGWWADDANENDQKLIKSYAGVEDGRDIAWAMIQIGMRSVAKTTIFTMQARAAIGSRVWGRVKGLTRGQVQAKWQMQSHLLALQRSHIWPPHVRSGHEQ